MHIPRISQLFQGVMKWKSRTANLEPRAPIGVVRATAFEVGRSRFNVRSFLLSVLLLSATTVVAGLPQPMCVYYGQALDGYGWPYTTNAQVVLLHGASEIASQTIQGSISPGVNFALYVHLDDGRTATSYSPRALCSGDLVSIVVRDQDGEKTIMERQAIPPVGKPGEFIAIHVTAADDSDGDGLPDPWERELIDWSDGGLTSILEVNPWDDFDRDGQSNGDEYLAGTFAFLDYDSFFAEDHGSTVNGRFRISFLSVAGKLYGVRYVTALNQAQWTPAPLAISETNAFQARLIEGTGEWISVYVPGNLRDAFFRPTVESLDSYPLTSTEFVTSLSAQDNAANAPYPDSGFQVGDNGGSNFLPWVRLEGNASSGSLYWGEGIGGSAHAWGLRGTSAVGRSLPGVAHHGLWQVRLVHDPDTRDFSGFNLKSTRLEGFAATETIRVGMVPGQVGFDGRGIHVSLDGGQAYTFLDCGWADGRGDSILYQLWWDETGQFTLTVVNEDEGRTARFDGRLPTSAVSTLGVAVYGSPARASIQFDSLAYESQPALNIQSSSSELVLSWPTGFPDSVLESSDDVSQPGVWTRVDTLAVVAQGQNRVTVTPTRQQQFFRLRLR